ncbi:MAG: hypothetical protein ABH873_03030, partial [Candidatus Firestonebacteria bacterium]
MRTHSDKFYPIFLENEKFSFINKVILEGSFSLISIMRAKLEAHYTGDRINPSDEESLKIDLEKMNKCLDFALENNI